MKRTGWYRLSASGQIFHGTLPTGAVEVDAPSPGDELVEPVEGGLPVGADDAGGDLAADAAELGDGEREPVDDPGDDDPDGVAGQDAKPTRARARRGAQGDG